MDISKKLVETHSLTKEECLELFSLFNNSEVMEYLKQAGTIAITVEYEEIIVTQNDIALVKKRFLHVVQMVKSQAFVLLYYKVGKTRGIRKSGLQIL